MPQITTKALSFAVLGVLALALSGCGDENSHSSFDPDKGAHPDDWLPARHAAAAIGNLEDCTPCHGADFNGGISKVACTSCHLGNQTDVHPVEWGAHDYARHGDWIRQRVIASGVASSDIDPGALARIFPAQTAAAAASCANVYCHGADYRGVADSGPSCFDDQPGAVDSSCHAGNQFSYHPLDWFPARFTTRAGIVPTILPAHGPYVITYGSAECSIPVCHGSGTPATIKVGVGSTRITGTTPTTPNWGFTGFTGYTTGATEATVSNTGRLCAACHF